MIKREYPILEFDSETEAIINPSRALLKYPKFDSDKLVITFFREVIDKLIEENKIVHYQTITGENDLIIYKFIDDEALIVHGTIGCAACGGYLDEMIALGINKIMFCGGGGVLDKTIDVGNMMIVTGAIRDEGFSYHYVEPSRIIDANQDVIKIIERFFTDNCIDYFKGITWTTDAFYRETKEKVKLRKEEGAKIVEMEQAGCIAVSQFRNVQYGAIIYAGDDVSGSTWDQRDWRSRRGIRYDLVNICKEILQIL